MRAAVAAIAVLALARAASAQEPSTYIGKVYARQMCASCYAVEAGETESPAPKAPAFQKVEDAPGMAAIALSAWVDSIMPGLKQGGPPR